MEIPKTDDVTRVPALLEEFGGCILKGGISKEVVEEVRAGCAELVAEWAAAENISDKCTDMDVDHRLIHLASLVEPGNVPTLFRRELFRENFFGLFAAPSILNVASLLFGDAECSGSVPLRLYPNQSIRPKIPDPRDDSPFNVAWHQDAGLQADGSPATSDVREREDAFGLDSMVNVWVPFVDVGPTDGPMKFVLGSHKRGIMEHERVGDYEGVDKALERASKSGDTVPIGAYRTSIRRDLLEEGTKDAVLVVADVGDVVFFSNMLWHGGTPNTGDKIRWTCDFRIQRADKPTLRPLNGHILRGTSSSIKSASEWATQTVQ